jgi:methylated-DNA-[protein]-cysteine S-methyltransferase
MEVELFGGAVDIDLKYLDLGPDALCEQVQEYAAGERRTFELDVSFPESFTGRVMAAMAAIPYGETRTYGELAEALDTSARAVGGGCGRNPVPVVVPCHRVVRSDGGLGGYSTAGGVELKRRLLDHETRER